MKQRVILKIPQLFPVKSLKRSTHGAALIEYGILAGIIAVTSIGTVFSVGEKIDGAYVAFKDSISNPQPNEGGGAPAPVADPYAAPSPYHPTDSCATYSPGNDNEVSNNSVECYALLTGSDTFDASAHTSGVSVYSDASPDSLNPDAPDTITLSAFDDYFQGHGRPTITAGAGNDTIDLILERNSVAHTIDLGDGNDFLKIKATDFDGTEAGKIDIKTGYGKETVDLDCNHNTRPNYNLRLLDEVKLRSSCEIEINAEAWPMDIIFDAELSAANKLMDTTKSNLWTPGFITGKIKLNDANHRMQLQADLNGSISIFGTGSPAPGDLTMWVKSEAGSLPNLALDVTGTYGKMDISLSNTLNNSFVYDAVASEESDITYLLGPDSASGKFPDVNITGAPIRLRFDAWTNASSDDLTLSLIRDNGSTYKTYDMAASGWNTSAEFFNRVDENITKAVVTRGTDSFEILFNTAGSDLDVRELRIYYDAP